MLVSALEFDLGALALFLPKNSLTRGGGAGLAGVLHVNQSLSDAG